MRKYTKITTRLTPDGLIESMTINSRIIDLHKYQRAVTQDWTEIRRIFMVISRVKNGDVTVHLLNKPFVRQLVDIDTPIPECYNLLTRYELVRFDAPRYADSTEHGCAFIRSQTGAEELPAKVKERYCQEACLCDKPVPNIKQPTDQVMCIHERERLPIMTDDILREKVEILNQLANQGTNEFQIMNEMRATIEN